jgi:hypothetical protein
MMICVCKTREKPVTRKIRHSGTYAILQTPLYVKKGDMGAFLSSSPRASLLPSALISVR